MVNLGGSVVRDRVDGKTLPLKITGRSWYIQLVSELLIHIVFLYFSWELLLPEAVSFTPLEHPAHSFLRLMTLTIKIMTVFRETWGSWAAGVRYTRKELLATANIRAADLLRAEKITTEMEDGNLLANVPKHVYAHWEGGPRNLIVDPATELSDTRRTAVITVITSCHIARTQEPFLPLVQDMDDKREWTWLSYLSFPRCPWWLVSGRPRVAGGDEN